MRKISTARTSRRAPGLKDSDYDHEIALVDHATEAVTPQRLSPETPAEIGRTDHALASAHTADADQILSNAASTGPTASSGHLSPQEDHPDARSTASASVATVSTKAKNSKGSLHKTFEYQASKGKAGIPTFEVEGKDQTLPSLNPFYLADTVSYLVKNLRRCRDQAICMIALATKPRGKLPLMSCMKTKEVAFSAVFLSFHQRLWVSLIPPHGPTLSTNRALRISTLRRCRTPAGCGHGRNGT